MSTQLQIPFYHNQDYTNLYDFQGLGIKVVREKPPIEEITISRPIDAIQLLHPIYNGEEREHFHTLILNARNVVEAINLVSVGSLNASLVHPREVYRIPILLSAACILVSHNHPSQDPVPSREDIELTRRLHKAGEVMGIELLDHIIYGNKERFTSMKESNLF